MNERPYYCLYRNTRTGYKGRRTFKTRQELTNFVHHAPMEYAITAYN